jgi:predicted protein tyrosine phosphatase
MTPASISLLTVCGLEELDQHRAGGVTHVLSILDPDWADPEAFGAFDPHHRTILRFHDVIEPGPGLQLPQAGDVEAVLAFGASLAHDAAERDEGHLLVHCHMGISRSTAAMATLIAQAHPGEDEDRILARLKEIRPQAWPNLRMMEFADDLLGRGGRLVSALGRLYGRQLSERPRLAEVMRRLNRNREVEMAEGAQASRATF